jgi:hypothetical protein
VALRGHRRLLAGIAALTAGGAAGLVWAERAFWSAYLQRAMRLRAEAGVQSGALVTEADLEDLPEPMARYIRFSGAVGKPRIEAVHLLHGGRFKTAAGAPWMPIRGEYFITAAKPSFAWYGRLRVAPGVHVAAIDSYGDGHGRMLVKAMSLFRIADDQSDPVSRSAFGRCVAELTMAPTFFLNRQYVRCTQTGRDQVRCTVTDAGLSTDAELFVNEDGSLNRVVVMRYFDRGGGRATLERFTGENSRPQMFGGRMLASKMDGTWNLPEGDLHYVSFQIEHAAIE